MMNFLFDSHTHVQKETWHVTTHAKTCEPLGVPVKSYPCCSPLSPHLHPLTSTNGRREEEGARAFFNHRWYHRWGGGRRWCDKGGGVREREEWSHLLVCWMCIDHMMIMWWSCDYQVHNVIRAMNQLCVRVLGQLIFSTVCRDYYYCVH